MPSSDNAVTNSKASHRHSELNELYSNRKDHHFSHRHNLKMNDNDQKILEKLEAMSLQMYDGECKEISIQADEDDIDRERRELKLPASTNSYFDIMELPGNRVETKRIDLRIKEEVERKEVKLNIFSEIRNDGESLLETEMKSLNRMLNGFKKFKNGEDGNSSSGNSSSSSDDDDDDDETTGDSLWIGRYRRSKELIKKN